MATQTLKVGKVRVHVAAFGKHPGWDDHIEEIGLDTDQMVRVKRVMYTEGMAGNIDSGAWEKLEDAQRLAAFHHVFYWRDRDSYIVGRMWSSSDGKGRTKYPMMVVAEVEGVPQWWAIQEILPRLEAVEQRCLATKTADGVRAAIGECRRGLDDAAAMLSLSPSGGTSDTELLQALVKHPGLDADGQTRLGLVRIAYEMEREMGAYTAGGSKTRTGMSSLGPSHIRVPACLSSPQGARAWLALLKRELSPAAGVLVIEPLGHQWLDLIVGDPTPASLFCVRANGVGMAPASAVPYTIPAESLALAQSKISAWATGGAAEPVQAAAPAWSGEKPSAGSAKKWLIPVIGVACLLIGVTILVIAFTGGGGKGGEAPEPKVDSPRSSSAKPEGASEQQSASQTPKKDTAGALPAPEKGGVPAAPPPAPVAKDAPESTPIAKPEPKPEAKPENKPEPKPEVVPQAKPDVPSTKAGDGGGSDDPRSEWKFDSRAQATAEQIESLRKDLGAAPDKLKGVEALAKVTEDLKGRVGKLRSLVAQTRGSPWTEANKVKIRETVGSVDRDLDTVGKEVDAARGELVKLLKAHAEATPSPVDASPYKEAWAGSVSRVDVSQGWVKASQELARRATVLRSAADEQSKAMAWQPAIPEGSKIDALSVSTTLDRKREQAKQEIAERASAGEQDLAAQALRAYGEFERAFKQAVEGTVAAEAGLRAGGPVATSSSPEAELKKLRDSSALTTDPAFQPIVTTLGELKTIEASGDAAGLAEQVRRLGMTGENFAAARALSAWARMGTLKWPLNAAQAKDAAALLTLIRRDLSGQVTAAAKDGYVKAATTIGRGMWLDVVTRAADLKDGSAEAVGALDEALKVAPDLGVDDAAAEIKKLPDWVRYNLAMREFQKETAANLGEHPRLGAVKTAAARFIEAAGASGVGDRAGVKSFVDQVAAQVAKAPDRDTSRGGPGGAGWTQTETADDSIATFHKAFGGAERALTFRRVTGRDVDPPVYLCTTEVSVGLAIDVINEKLGATGPVAPIGLDATAKKASDFQRGPRGWRWIVGTGLAVAAPVDGDEGKGWFSYVSDAARASYAPELRGKVAEPSAEMPLQGMSAATLSTLARAMGCRFPTVAEWKLAAGSSAGSSSNRRDLTWKKQFDFAAAQLKLNPDRRPGDVINPRASTYVTSDSEEAAVQTDDSTLWFVPVGSGPQFQHLIGNVAEVAFDDVSVWQKTAETMKDIRVLFKGDSVDPTVMVLGGSAMSPAGDPTVPTPMVLTKECADVGLRLAFTAPVNSGPAAEEWKGLMSRGTYCREANK